MAGPISEDSRWSSRHRDIMGATTAGTSQLPVHLIMLLSQTIAGGYYVVTGFARIVLSLYRDVFAMSCLVPAAYFLDRGNRVRLSWKVFSQLLLLGLTGIYGSNYLLYVGIEYTTPGASSAVQPMIPVLTALIAILFRTEVVRWHRRDGQAKIWGIISSCIGAFVMTFYIGPAVIRHGIQHSPPSIPGSGNISSLEVGLSLGLSGMKNLQVVGWEISTWQAGSLCLIGQCLCLAIFINVQTPLLKVYPAPVSVMAYSFGFGAIFMAVTGYILVPDPDEWALGFDANLATVVYSGVIASALNFVIMAWCLTRVGPVFVASYIPMQPVVAAALAFIFLGTSICLGNILGMILLTIGLVLVSWARQESSRLDSISGDLDSNDDESPFHTTEKDALKESLIQVGHS